MSIGWFLKNAAPSYVRNYMASIQDRLARLEQLEVRVNGLQTTIRELETAVDSLVQNPRYSPSDGAGFNGQLQRKKIFRDVIAAFDFKTIVETGTWIGNTTAYMAETSGLPVFSCELSPRYWSIARMRLVDVPGVTLRNADSRRLLEELGKEPPIAAGKTFFYLDAHWYEDLPLAEEIDLIARDWSDFIIMIDDFQVPGDDGYGYDDFGPGKALTPEYIYSELHKHDLRCFYPAAPSEKETGAIRGCVLITRAGPDANRMAAIPSLRIGS